MDIRKDDLSGIEIQKLLLQHLQHMIEITPEGSVHALDLNSLKSPDITFWSVWENSQLLGCCALKQLATHHGEIKSMRTADEHLGKGVASVLLQHILKEAKKRHYKRISLETGAYDAFIPARKLYEKFGFTPCGPFADYEDNGNSVFMTKEL